MKKEQRKHREHLIDSIVDSFGEALKEDSDEIEEIDEIFDEGDDVQNEEPPRKIHRGFVTVAALMLIFSVIGAVNSVRFISAAARDIADKKSLKNEFAQFVYPVVINDPPAYDNIDTLQHTTIITCAIWKIILTGDKSHYEKSEMTDTIKIPAIDVQNSAYMLFGIRELIHQSAGNIDAGFIYDDDNKVYEVPANPRFISYSPLVSEISVVGELYTVTIDYMPPSPLAIAGIEYDATPVKTMIYTITRAKDKMTIMSIKFANTAGL